MTRRSIALLFCLLTTPLAAQDKPSLYKSINSRADATWEAAMKIWGWAEPGYQETKSSALLAGMLERAGFDVRRGVAEIPTAFTAMRASDDRSPAEFVLPGCQCNTASQSLNSPARTMNTLPLPPSSAGHP